MSADGHDPEGRWCFCKAPACGSWNDFVRVFTASHGRHPGDADIVRYREILALAAAEAVTTAPERRWL